MPSAPIPRPHVVNNDRVTSVGNYTRKTIEPNTAVNISGNLGIEDACRWIYGEAAVREHEPPHS